MSVLLADWAAARMQSGDRLHALGRSGGSKENSEKSPDACPEEIGFEDGRMRSIRFCVPGTPRGKERARTVHVDGRVMTFTPGQTVAYEDRVRGAFLKASGGTWTKVDTPLCIQILAKYPVPKSVSKKRRAAMLSGRLFPTKKPDWDNVGKIICDALNGIAYRDDAQIVFAAVSKSYTEGEGCVEVTLTALEKGA